MKGSKERLFIDTQSANFRGNVLCPNYKTTLKQQLNGWKRWKMRWETIFKKDVKFFLSSPSASKNVGMTTTCNRCDVINIMWRKIRMTEEWNRKVRRWGGGGGEGERESAELGGGRLKNPELFKALSSFQPGVGQYTAFHALLTARKSTEKCLASAWLIYSALFSWLFEYLLVGDGRLIGLRMCVCAFP